jgi:hypothetical protein
MEEKRLYEIFRLMNAETFSKDLASRLVGGRARLIRLIEAEKIRAIKPTNKQNGKWRVNAADVLRNVLINF